MNQYLFLQRAIALLVLSVSLTVGGVSGDPAQIPFCSMSGTETEGQQLHRGGRYITSTGTLRVLVAFVRFPDDVNTSATWPDPNVLPDWAQHILDNTYSASGNYTPWRSSKWFYENSYGQFHVIGDVYYVTTHHNEDYYHQLAGNYPPNPGRARAAIETEIFNKLDAAPYNVDFNLYDNWKSNSIAFSNVVGKDSVLDMCWIITRNLHDENYESEPTKKFAIGWATLDCPSVYKDGVLIKGSEYYFPASGIGGFQKTLDWPISAYEATDGLYTFVNFLAHEMGHYLFGDGHFAVMNESPFLSSQARSSSSLKAHGGGWWGHYSGYEKWRLNWLSPTVISTDNPSVLLYDQATTTNSSLNRLIEIPIAGTTQFFLIENRRWISGFETRYAPNGGDSHAKMKPGLMVYHIVEENDWIAGTKIKLLCADGKFVWKMISYGPDPSNRTTM